MWFVGTGRNISTYSPQRSYHVFGEPKRRRLVLCSVLGPKDGNDQRQLSVHNKEKPYKNIQLLKSGKTALYGSEHLPTPRDQAFTEWNVEFTFLSQL